MERDQEIKRKLATILVADIVGYSSLTAHDEDWTIRALGEFRKIVDDIIASHDGRIFSTGGDSVLAEFASPVEAVRAAVDFQEASRSRNLLQPRDRQLRYRIGINLGDVMVRGNDLLGRRGQCRGSAGRPRRTGRHLRQRDGLGPHQRQIVDRLRRYRRAIGQEHPASGARLSSARRRQRRRRLAGACRPLGPAEQPGRGRRWPR